MDKNKVEKELAIVAAEAIEKAADEVRTDLKSYNLPTAANLAVKSFYSALIDYADKLRASVPHQVDENEPVGRGLHESFMEGLSLVTRGSNDE
jgi:hypothetical protein